MIKNEEKILERCLKAVENLVDVFCICDTGSTDRTREIATKFLETRVGCLTDEPFRDFGHNRTVSFVNAQSYIRDTLKWNLNEVYGLLLDADMMFVQGTLKEQNLTETGYKIIQLNGGLEYYNARIVRMDYPWKCVSVTHEYWAGPTVNLSKDICYIDDRNDGGCKTDKFERDQRLLEKGLADEPTNVRYMFYLAQTYKCLGKLTESIAMYKKRVKAGGWHEEVWYSYYMIGECYRNLRNIPNFEKYMQIAHAFHSKRTESIHKLAEFFRTVGQHHKAYHYIQIGKQTPFPKDDSLFIESSVYGGMFDYEASIVEFYIHPERGLRSSIDCMLKTPQNQQNVVSNLKFYVKPIGTIEKLNLPSLADEFHPSAISLCNYPMANVRYINYEIKDGNYIAPNNIVQTKNAYINLETNEIQIELPDLVDLPVFPTNIKGLEDIRLFKKNEKIYFTATSVREYSNAVRVVTGEYPYANCKVLNSPINAECEKNWLPIEDTDSMIYNWFPLKVIENGIITTTHNTPPLFNLFRGSAPPIKVNDKWWTLVHIVEYAQLRNYYHLFVELDVEFNPLRITLPFTFKGTGIEYCVSCRTIADTIECYVSFMDSNPHRVTINKSSLEWVSV